MSGERCFQTHIAGRKHQSKLKLPIIDAEQFRNPINRNAPHSKLCESKNEKVLIY